MLQEEQYIQQNKLNHPADILVGGFAWSYEAESYAGGSVATGRVSHVEQVQCHDPGKGG
jgi:hypothetical protein